MKQTVSKLVLVLFALSLTVFISNSFVVASSTGTGPDLVNGNFETGHLSPWQPYYWDGTAPDFNMAHAIAPCWAGVDVAPKYEGSYAANFSYLYDNYYASTHGLLGYKGVGIFQQLSTSVQNPNANISFWFAVMSGTWGHGFGGAIDFFDSFDNRLQGSGHFLYLHSCGREGYIYGHDPKDITPYDANYDKWFHADMGIPVSTAAVGIRCWGNETFVGTIFLDKVEIIVDSQPPVIGAPVRTPEGGEVGVDQTVSVSVGITDDESGVKNASLFYTLDNGTSWKEPLSMGFDAAMEVYEATMPSQSPGTWVGFKIVAYDYAENQAVREVAERYLVKMPTSVSISTTSPSTSAGFRVDINGTLRDLYGKGVENKPVVLSYIFEGASGWVPITSGVTDSLGRYQIQWLPSATGYFELKAEWAGNRTHFGASNTVTLSSISHEAQYIFSVESNSSVSALAFNKTSSELSFTVSGLSGTSGYVKATLAKSLVPDAEGLTVLIDGIERDYSCVSVDDSWLLTFTYTHSSHRVEIRMATGARLGPAFLGFDWWVWLVIIVVIAGVLAAGGLMLRRRKARAPRTTTK